MTIIIDAMSGADAPKAAVAAAADVSLTRKLELALVGDESAITAELARVKHKPELIMVRHAESDEDDPRMAALDAAAQMLTRGRGAALVTAGPNSATLSQLDSVLTRIPGVPQPALCAVYPTVRRRGAHSDPFTLILDVGAHVDAGVDDLVGYAKMGSAYASRISRNPHPRVAMLAGSFGADLAPADVREACDVLSAEKSIEFIGPISGLGISRGEADVIVSSGFVGNVVIEVLEGIQDFALDFAKVAEEAGLRRKLAIRTLEEDLMRVRTVTDWREYGGAPLLGYAQPVIFTEHNVDTRVYSRAIRLAAKAVREDIPGAVTAAFQLA